MNMDLALSKLKIFRELGKGKFHVLSFGVFKSNFYLHINEIEQDTKGKSKHFFTTPVMFTNLRMFSNVLKSLSKQKEDYTFTMELYSPKWVNDKIDRTGKQLKAKLGCGRVKNKEGEIVNVIFVSTDQNVKYVFPLLPSPYMEILINNERVTDKEKLSNLWADAYAKAFNDVIVNLPEVRIENNGDDKFSKNKKNGAKKEIDDILDDI